MQKRLFAASCKFLTWFFVFVPWFGQSLADSVESRLCSICKLEFLKNTAHILGNSPLVDHKRSRDFLINLILGLSISEFRVPWESKGWQYKAIERDDPFHESL